MHLNLQYKFILLTTPLIVFPLLLLGWFSYTQLKQTTEERTFCLLDIGEQVVAMLNGLSQLCMLLALDDFGTGYSSLMHLKRFCVDRLKIDRSFMRDLDVNEDDAAICAAIIAMSHKLGIAVTAEGVEQTLQLDKLVSWSCDQVQDYLICKPQPNAGFEAFIRERQSEMKATAGLGAQ